MNFSKQPQKNQPPTEKFYRSSALFMQLGLVLALLIVYVSLEFTSTKTITLFDDFIPDEEQAYVFTAPPDIIIEKKQEPKEKQKREKVPLTDHEIVPDNTKFEDVLDLPTTDDQPKIDIGEIDEVIEKGDDDIPPIPFEILEEAPVFPGCEGLEKQESKACFTKQMTKFVNRKFDAGIAEGLNLTGKQRIFALFTIDKNGLVTDIKIRAPHKTLEKEALRVIQKLPEMIPGKQRKKAVPVKYTLPIVFEIH
ncbi:energy transducer TonB [Aureibaculum sp. 2210JD6-5]|uniref:energy transducer TonB n=1 Tax=Aureibaculum sp. 2210JD6-5 TaxID=3103957 RepID=UPI002AAD57CF|nr:energy transducer TonB [Aureibaculum sp. 2210JD6-5]MDY7394588.1 energy transducer TonB [Aureibaculum sp. 2210JD6-5]